MAGPKMELWTSQLAKSGFEQNFKAGKCSFDTLWFNHAAKRTFPGNFSFGTPETRISPAHEPAHEAWDACNLGLVVSK